VSLPVPGGGYCFLFIRSFGYGGSLYMVVLGGVGISFTVFCGDLDNEAFIASTYHIRNQR
jgi:hypothetical protein